MGFPTKVSVTMNGTTFSIPPGIYSMKELGTACGVLKAATMSITTAHPTQPTTINGNDSVTILGGEVITATAGV